jgi:ragB/susD domain protein
LLRASEAYLNLAEAQAMQGKSAEASATLGRLQQRRIADYSPTPLSGKALVDEIRAERRRELCFEGQRWFDLRRYAVNTVQPLKKNVVHAFNAYSNSNAFLTTHTFVLPAGDPAYTFSIPLSVIEFDKVPMPNNIRPKREEVKQPKPLPSLPTDDEDNPTPTPAP